MTEECFYETFSVETLLSDRRRELSALPNEEVCHMLSGLMTLMHSWLIRVTLVAGKVFTNTCDTGNHSAM